MMEISNESREQLLALYQKISTTQNEFKG